MEGTHKYKAEWEKYKEGRSTVIKMDKATLFSLRWNRSSVVTIKQEGVHTGFWQLAALYFQAWKDFALVSSLKVFCINGPAHKGKENVTQLHLYFSPLISDRRLGKLPDWKIAASYPESFQISHFIIGLWWFATSSLQGYSIMTSSKRELIFFKFLFHRLCLPWRWMTDVFETQATKVWDPQKARLVSLQTAYCKTIPTLWRRSLGGRGKFTQFTHLDGQHERIL